MSKIIKTNNYQGEDRRTKLVKEQIPPLDETFKSWLPIFVPILGVCVSVGMYIALVSSTAVLAKDTQCRVETNELESRNRDEKLTLGYNDNKLKIAQHDTTIKIFQEQLLSINNKLDKLLIRTEYK